MQEYVEEKRDTGNVGVLDVEVGDNDNDLVGDDDDVGDDVMELDDGDDEEDDDEDGDMENAQVEAREKRFTVSTRSH